VARRLVWVILDRIGRSASRPLSPDSDRIADNIGGRQFRIFRISLDGQVESGLLQFGPASSRGRFAIVTDVERGMRWTLWRRKTSGVLADGEVVWS
jgi:hypothetical protein